MAAGLVVVTDAALEDPFGFCIYISTPGQVISTGTFYVGRLKNGGAVWQLTAVDVATGSTWEQAWLTCWLVQRVERLDRRERFGIAPLERFDP